MYVYMFRRLFVSHIYSALVFFFFQAEDGIRDLVRSRGLGDVYKRQAESALLLYARLLRARTPEGWEVTDLLAAGASQKLSLIHI